MTFKEKITRLFKQTLFLVIAFMIIAYSYEWYKTYQFKHHIETNPYYALDSLSGHFHSINHERMIQWPEHSNGQFNMKTNT